MSLPTFLRFSDLKQRGIVNNRPALKQKIEKQGFPPGRRLGPNTRAWTVQEIDRWLKSRPTAPKAAPRRGRPRKAERTAEAGA